jgi:TRAP-type C4-dicarboxylate transport system substrate-binding protein
MRYRRRDIVAAALLSPVVVLGTQMRAGAQTILKFSHTDNPGGSRQAAAELFARKVEEYTQGRYKVQVYPAGQLANDPKAVEQLQLGGIDFTVTAPLSSHEPFWRELLAIVAQDEGSRFALAGRRLRQPARTSGSRPFSVSGLAAPP